MRRITFLEDEWCCLVALAAIPRRRIFAEDSFSREVVRFLVEKGVAAEEGELLAPTDLGREILARNPPPSPVGARLWVERFSVG